MDTAYWKRVQELFERAAELPAADRDTFLRDACPDQPEVVADVQALLQADQASNILLDGMAADAVDYPAAPAESAVEGSALGPYRVIRRLGTGGMGDVYLAERADGHFEQQVALKLIKRGMDSAEILGRFNAERQILANLQHPHIGRLLDGGAAPDGRPFYAMEYVDGVPITVYCDQEKLNVEQRLRLFQDVCSAVRYAQERLVVHRDLKPSNILVTQDGTVKLLDFGIAKVLEGGDAIRPETDATRTGTRIMTPAYASPEQVRGETVTTATDVYALGIILFELLTGSRPFQVEGLSPREMEDLIISTEPPRPSAQVSARTASSEGLELASPEERASNRSTPLERLRRRLSGDLDNICLKALRKDPPRRYASAAELLEDIQLHLEGMPVHARPDSFAYRTQKFVGRHKLALGALLTVLAVVISLTTYYTAQLATERDRAREQAAKAESVSAFLAGLYELADPTANRGEEVTARDMLDRGARRVNVEFSGQPDVRARMLLVIAQVYDNLGLYDEARAHAEEAVSIRTEFYGADHLAVAEAYGDLARILFNQGEVDSSVTLARIALDYRQAQLGRSDTLVARAMVNLADFLIEQRDLDAADSLYAEALRIQQAWHRDRHPLTAECLGGMGSVAYGRSDYAAARDLWSRSLDMRLHLYGEIHPDVYVNLNNLGLALEPMDSFERATECYERSLKITQQLYGEDHHSADAYAFMARINVALDLFTRAEPRLREALRLRKIGLAPDHFLIGYDWKQLGDVLLSLHKYDEADQAFDSALAIFEVNSPDSDPYMASALLGKGRSLVYHGRAEEALPYMERGVAIREAALPDDHWVLASARGHLGWCYIHLGRYEEAESLLIPSYLVFKEKFGELHGRTRAAVERLCELYTAWDKPDLANHYSTKPGPVH